MKLKKRVSFGHGKHVQGLRIQFQQIWCKIERKPLQIVRALSSEKYVNVILAVKTQINWLNFAYIRHFHAVSWTSTLALWQR